VRSHRRCIPDFEPIATGKIAPNERPLSGAHITSVNVRVWAKAPCPQLPARPNSRHSRDLCAFPTSDVGSCRGSAGRNGAVWDEAVVPEGYCECRVSDSAGRAVGAEKQQGRFRPNRDVQTGDPGSDNGHSLSAALAVSSSLTSHLGKEQSAASFRKEGNSARWPERLSC
jgi:hypothetical protein